jgi:hypothetical protein
MVYSRVSRYSYGIVKTPAFDFNEHNPEDKMWDPACGIWRAHQIEWLLRKGQEFEEGSTLTTEDQRTIQVRLRNLGRRKFYDVLLYCGKEIPPQHYTNGSLPNTSPF